MSDKIQMNNARFPSDRVGLVEISSQINPAMTSAGLMDNLIIKHLFSSSNDGHRLNHFLDNFLSLNHPFKVGIFHAIDAMSDDQILDETDKILKLDHDDQGGTKGLPLYEKWDVRQLVLLPITGKDSLNQVLATNMSLASNLNFINTILSSDSDSDLKDILTVNIKHTYLLMKAVAIISRRPDLFHPEDAESSSPYFKYLAYNEVMSEGTGLNEIVRYELSYSTLIMGQLMGRDVTSQQEAITTHDLVEAINGKNKRDRQKYLESINSFLRLIENLREKSPEWERGISVLERKNDIYVQNIEKLRQAAHQVAEQEIDGNSAQLLDDDFAMKVSDDIWDWENAKIGNSSAPGIAPSPGCHDRDQHV